MPIATPQVWIPNSAPKFQLSYGAELKIVVDWDRVLTDNEVVTFQTFNLTPYKSEVPNLNVKAHTFDDLVSTLVLETTSETQLYQRFILTVNIETSNGEVVSRSCYIKVVKNFEELS